MPADPSAGHTPPWLLLMKGHPGIGKSTLARALCRRLGWSLIGKDHVRQAQQSVGLVRPGPYDVEDRFSEAMNDLTYEITWTMAGEQLGHGLSAVIDSPLAHERLFHRAVAVASRFDAFLGVVEVRLGREEHRRRVQLRGACPDLRPKRFCRWEEVDAQLGRYAGCWAYSIPEATRLVIDGSADEGRQVELILQWIRRRSFGAPDRGLDEVDLGQIGSLRQRARSSPGLGAHALEEGEACGERPRTPSQASMEDRCDLRSPCAGPTGCPSLLQPKLHHGGRPVATPMAAAGDPCPPCAAQVLKPFWLVSKLSR